MLSIPKKHNFQLMSQKKELQFFFNDEHPLKAKLLIEFREGEI